MHQLQHEEVGLQQEDPVSGTWPGEAQRRPVLLLLTHRQATCCPSPGSPGDQAHTYLESSLCVCTNHGLSVGTQLSERLLNVPCLQHPPLSTLVQVKTSQNRIGAARLCPLPPGLISAVQLSTSCLF